MLKKIIALMTTGLLAGAAFAGTPTPVESPATNVAQILQEAGYAQATPAIAEATEGRIIQAQSFPFPPWGGGQCEGYEPDPGCTVVFNDGEWCTERCEPNTQILQICSCSR